MSAAMPDLQTSPQPPRAGASPFSRPVLEGRREVAGLWWPDGWLSPQAERQDLLRHWKPGATVYRFADGLLLRLSAAVSMDCSDLTAWPLQRRAGVLCSADVNPDRLATLPRADAWWVVAGQARALHLAQAREENVASWLDVDLPCLEPLELRQPEPDRTLVIEDARPLSEVLGPAVPQSMAPQTRQLLDSLMKASRGRRSASAGRDAAASGVGSRAAGRLRKLLPAAGVAAAGLVLTALAGGGSAVAAAPLTLGAAALGGLLGLAGALGATGVAARIARMRERSRSNGSGSSGAAQGAAQGAARGAASGTGKLGGGLRQRLQRSPILPQRWRDWMTRMAVASGLSHALTARQSAYLRKMLRMFDDGQLDEALRHALPLGGQQGSLGQAFSAPGRRHDLRLSDSASGASTSIHLAPKLEHHLRDLYRRSAQQLEAKGRIDEAVFVYAELLNDRTHALELLERHQRFKQAAELALGWDVPPATIIRLHVLAGDWQRAELVARRDGGWKEAVPLLEARWPEAGRRLRQLWAESLAAQGRWLDAARVLWPCTDARDAVLGWIESASQAGGGVSTRALAWRALACPETLQGRVAEITSLQCDRNAVRERAALVDELLRLPGDPTPATRRLALMVIGASVADQASPHACTSGARLTDLVALAQDAALKADLPGAGLKALGTPSLPLNQQAATLTGWVPEAGLHAVLDAGVLANGELLVALGESGAVRLDASGRRLDHFPVPSDVLVVAEDGCSALALARRDAVWRVTRLDLMHRRSVDLGLHTFDAFADRFNGAGWTVGVQNRVQVLDVMTPGLRDVWWQVADLPGQVVRIERNAYQETWLLRSDEALQQWVYVLPQRRLQSREELPPLTELQRKALDTEGSPRLMAGIRGLLEFRMAGPVSDESWLCGLTGGSLRLGSFDRTGMQVMLADHQWLAMMSKEALDATPDADDRSPRRLIRLHQISGPCRLAWQWPADARLRLRAQGDHWLVFDSLGRIATVDVRTGAQTARST